jgi:DNA-binding transcriptional regulator YdaS (Cro superfamily)
LTNTTKEQRNAAVDTAVQRAGGIVRFAKALGITHQAVYDWKRRGWVPLERAVAIESIFGIPRAELMNPDVVRAMNTPPVTDIL